MIQAIDFPERNSYFYNWVQGEIAFTVPAFQNGRLIISCWQFSPEALQRLQAANGRLYMLLNGHGDLATLSLTVTTPFNNNPEKLQMNGKIPKNEGDGSGHPTPPK